MKVRLYIEGGGKGELLDTVFREGWSTFFRAAGLEGRMPKIIRGGSREQTFERFQLAVKTTRADELPLLLVDSETAYSATSVWQHLKANDNWERPAGVGDDQAFLMVQVMETWLLADRELLLRFFGSSLREKTLREWPSLEALPKSTVLQTLDLATADCAKPYAKGKISFELLAKSNPTTVEQACPSAKRLLDRLREL